MMKCHWCNAEHTEAFIVCATCKRKRKDIVDATNLSYGYFIAGLLSVIACIYLGTKVNSENENPILFLTGSFISIIAAIAFFIIGLVITVKINKKTNTPNFNNN